MSFKILNIYPVVTANEQKLFHPSYSHGYPILVFRQMPTYKHISRQRQRQSLTTGKVDRYAILRKHSSQRTWARTSHKHTKQSNYSLENIEVYFASLNTEIGIIYQVSRTSEMNILLIESGLCLSLSVCVRVFLCLCLHVSALQRKWKGYLFNFSIIKPVVRCFQTIAMNRKHNWWEDTFTFTKISGNLRINS